MLHWIGWGFLLFCTVQGLVQLLGWGMVILLCPKGQRHCFTLLPVQGEDPQIELKLLWAGFCQQWGWQKGPLILLNLSAGPETLAICHTWCRNREWVELLTPDQLAEIEYLDGVYKTFRGVLY